MVGMPFASADTSMYAIQTKMFTQHKPILVNGYQPSVAIDYSSFFYTLHQPLRNNHLFLSKILEVMFQHIVSVHYDCLYAIIFIFNLPPSSSIFLQLILLLLLLFPLSKFHSYFLFFSSHFSHHRLDGVENNNNISDDYFKCDIIIYQINVKYNLKLCYCITKKTANYSYHYEFVSG